MASPLPLGGSVVQRLQRFGTYGHLKQVVLAIIANEISQQQALTQSTLQQLRRVPRCALACGHLCAQGERTLSPHKELAADVSSFRMSAEAKWHCL